MIGILLMSHGQLANGALDSLKLFMGGELEKVEALCLNYEDSAEDFEKKITDAIARLDDGSGVVGLCDLAGGTPGNICTRLANDQFHVILGFNIGLGLELLGKRFAAETVQDIDFDETVETCKSRFVYLNGILNAADDDDE